MWNFENTKDTPLGRTSEAAAAKFRRMEYASEDFYEHFPCFIGAKWLARYLSFYECYQKTLGLAGHIADVGTNRGAVALFFAKLSLLYEPHAVTQVHGFDLFEWGETAEGEKGFAYVETYARVKDLVECQGLQRYALMHQLNLLTELKGFFEQNSHLQFRLVFLDVGEYDLVSVSLREFWPRLTPGGIVIFDQFNFEAAPGETKAVKELLPASTVIRTFPNGWMPTAYVVKE